MSQRYITTVVEAGGLPWMIPLLADETALRGIYELLDGVFLPGGADIDPASYRAERHAACDKTDPARDAVELALIRWAIEDRKPVLGICRGVQLMNIAVGGTLHQSLADQLAGAIKHDYFPFGGQYRRDHLAHTVRIPAGSRLAAILGDGERAVNSMHHQGIDRLGEGLVATATAPDGLIEAAEATSDHWMVGVQWHPEALTDGDAVTRRLFAAFIAASEEYRGSRMASA